MPHFLKVFIKDMTYLHVAAFYEVDGTFLTRNIFNCITKNKKA